MGYVGDDVRAVELNLRLSLLRVVCTTKVNKITTALINLTTANQEKSFQRSNYVCILPKTLIKEPGM